MSNTPRKRSACLDGFDISIVLYRWTEYPQSKIFEALHTEQRRVGIHLLIRERNLTTSHLTYCHQLPSAMQLKPTNLHIK